MTQKATLNLQENRDIGQVLNATFAFIRIVFKPLYRDVLIISGPFYLLAGIFSSLSTYNLVSKALGALGGVNMYLYQFYSPAYWLNLLFLLIAWSLSTVIIGNHVLQYKLNGPDYSPVEARKGIREDIMRVIFGNFLNLLVILAACILFLIPGIYLAVANSLLTTILILDKRMSTIDAFSESRRLVRNNWWATLGLGIIIGIITSAMQFVFKIPSTIVSTIITFSTLRHTGDAASYQTLFIALNALAFFGIAAVSPISMIASCIYYYSLKERKDHAGLIQNIDNIGVQPARTETETKRDEGDF